MSYSDNNSGSSCTIKEWSIEGCYMVKDSLAHCILTNDTYYRQLLLAYCTLASGALVWTTIFYHFNDSNFIMVGYFANQTLSNYRSNLVHFRHRHISHRNFLGRGLSQEPMALVDTLGYFGPCFPSYPNNLRLMLSSFGSIWP